MPRRNWPLPLELRLELSGTVLTRKGSHSQVKRNRRRFPAEFMFELSAEEAESLRSQSATLKRGRGTHRKYAPKVFTEHGALMLASVLNSGRAIEVSVLIVQAFVQMREFLRSHSELATRIDELERRLAGHDTAIATLLAAIRRLAIGESKPRRPIGFTADLK
jgi:hypothetical protein